MMLVIAGRELRSLFLSPLAWTVLAVVQVILAFMFLGQLDEYIALQPQLAMLEAPPGVTELVIAPLFASATFLLLLVLPLLTMRLLAEERRGGTLPLLFSAPVSMTEIVLGKYLGLLVFLGVMLALLALMPLSLLSVADLDLGLLAGGLLGLTLMLAAFGAAGLYLSSLTAQPVVAAVGTFGVLLLLWIIDWAGAVVSDGNGNVLAWLSLQRHYESLLRGIFSSADVAYYLLFITAFLVFTIRRLDSDRLQH